MNFNIRCEENWVSGGQSISSNLYFNWRDKLTLVGVAP